MTRRHALRLGIGGLAGLAAGGSLAFELVEHGVLPGKLELDELDGACDVAAPAVTYGAPGAQQSGSFYSHARGRTVRYTIAYPPGHGPGSRLPLLLALHALEGNPEDAIAGARAAQALAMRVGGAPLAPIAIAAAEGGNGYWHRHGRDDPMGMLIDELVPRCRRAGLGRPPQRIGATGVSMGGYGALLLAERRPDLIAAVAAISPAVWTSYQQARAANPGAFSSAADFAANDVVHHAARLRGTAVRVAAGRDDPFYPGVLALVRALPRRATVDLASGCHTSPFFDAQEPPSLRFLATHLAGARTT
jgi:enterochelin esterase-like enzyme